MVFITGLFLVSIWPYCLTFLSATISVPDTTKWLDWTFFFPLLNGMIQPLIYILSFERLREVFVKVICCQKRGEGRRTAMALAIFRTTRTLSTNLTNSQNSRSTVMEESNKSESPEPRKHSVISQVTILSEGGASDTLEEYKQCNPDGKGSITTMTDINS